MRSTALAFRLFLFLGLLASAAHAEDTARKEDTQKEEAAPAIREMIQGVVRDAATGKPLAGATIAARTRKGGVIAWGKADDQGVYRLDGRYVAHAHLPAYKEKDQSILGQIARGANSVFSLAARSAGSLVKPVARAAASAVGGPVAGAVAGEVAGKVAPRPVEDEPELPDPDDPGVLIVKVVCPGYLDYQGPVQAYWMDPPDLDEEDQALVFWLDPVALAPRTDDNKLRSGPRAESMRLRNAILEPSIAPRGAEVTISVHLDVPPVATSCVKVMARHEKTGAMAVLAPDPEKPGLFRGQMKIGADWPVNDQPVVLLALRCVPASPQGPRSATPEELADKLSLWRARRLVFDPQVLASRDRIPLTLTVVE